MAWYGGLLFVLVALVPVSVKADCEEDFRTKPVDTINLKEGSKPKVLWDNSYDVTVPSIPQELEDLFEFANNSLYLKETLLLDGQNNSKRCERVSRDIEFVVRCNDQYQQPKTLVIDVKFIDDHPPTFSSQRFEAEIYEENRIDVSVKRFVAGKDVTDEDCGELKLFYGFETSEDSSHFSISSPGEVITNSTLDYERQRIYNLNVSVFSQASSGGKRAYTLLRVKVKDLDDQDPMFSSPAYYLEVLESFSQTDLSGKWLNSDPVTHAFDGDTGINQPIVYSLNNSYQELDIQINSTSGQIRINSKLDREDISTYKFNIKAKQSDKSYKSAVAQLTLHVRDANDNVPKFSSPSHSLRLQEDAADGSWLMAFVVSDDDIGVNANNTITIATNDSSAFGLKQASDGSTWLVLVDAKSLQGMTEAHITVHATPVTPIEGDISCDYISTCVTNVTVTILDVNDHSPQFDKDRYDFKFPQPLPGFSKDKISAEDGDRDNNAKVTYAIKLLSGVDECKEAFRVNNETGDIILENDIQGTATCLFVATACDNPANIDNRLCTFVPVTIEVGTVSLNSTYTVSVEENAPIGTLVLSIPIPGLSVNNSVFAVTSYGLVTNATLDREAIAEYHLTLHGDASSATDTASNNLCDNTTACSAIVTVTILDINDHSPRFDQDTYDFRLSHHQAGSSVGNISATDEDVGNNANVTFVIHSLSEIAQCKGAFLVNVETGEISLVKDVYLAATCIFTATACDNPVDTHSRRCSVVPVTIDVDTITLNSTYKVSVAENAHIDTLVLRLPIHNLTVNSKAFRITSDGLVTNAVLDREVQDVYNLTITDGNVHGSQSSPKVLADVTVTILDVNDHSPLFDKDPYVFRLSHPQTGYSVGKIAVIDQDIGDNANVTLAIKLLSANEDCIGAFALQKEDGQIFLRKEIYRTTTCIFVATACDNPLNAENRLCSFAPMTIQIDTITLKSAYNVKVNENAPNGTLVLPLPVHNLTVDSPAFRITTEGLVTNTMLDRETTKEYHLTLGDADGNVVTPAGSNVSCGNTSSCLARVTVTILDFNDHSPQFGQDLYVFRLSQARVGFSVGKISATDKDEGDNAKVTYALQLFSGVDECKETFRVNETGEIVMEESIQLTTICLFVATACDSPSNQETRLCAFVPVQIGGISSVLEPTYHVSLVENTPIGTLVLPLSAHNLTVNDPDFIITLDGLTTNAKLDRETKAEYKLLLRQGNVLSNSSTSPATTGSCDNASICDVNVTVTIEDINDNSPQFNQSFYEFKLSRAQDGQNVGKVSASDKDEGDNAKMTFAIQLLSGVDDCKGAFRVDDGTGDIVLKNDIQGTVTCLLEATACDNPDDKENRLCTTVSVQVAIDTFVLEPTYQARVNENAPIETLVLPFPDRNITVNSTAFRVTTKGLVTNEVLDRESQAGYTVSLVDEDGKGSSSTVSIEVNDVNDNAPSPQQDVYNIPITGLEAIGAELVTIQASDADARVNAEVTFALLNGRGWLSVGQSSGVVRLVKMPSDKGLGETVEMFVILKDHGTPPLESVAKLVISLPSNDANTTASLIFALPREKVIKKMGDIKNFLSSTLALDVVVVRVEALAQVDDIGSIMYLKAQFKNGTEVPSATLQRLLAQNSQQIYEQFREEESSENATLFKILFIVTTILCVVILIALISVCRFYRKGKKMNRQRISIIQTLSKDIKIYDDTGNDDEEGEPPKLRNGGSSVQKSNGLTNGVTNGVAQKTASQFEFHNRAFVHDYDNDKDADGVDLYDKVDSNNGAPHSQSEAHNSLNSRRSGNIEISMNNWSFNPTTGQSQPSQENETSTDSAYSSPTRPFISTIKIENRASSSESAYKNIQPRKHSGSSALPSSPSTQVPANETKITDTDSGFRSDKEAHEEEEGSGNSVRKIAPDAHSVKDRQRSESESVDQTTTTASGEMQEEPEPDYAKKVHFNGGKNAGTSAEMTEGESTENIDKGAPFDKGVADNIPSNAFYFLEANTTVTAL